jgi:altronate hydrolase
MQAIKETFLRIHPKDNVLVALQDMQQGTTINFEGDSFALTEKIAAKQVQHSGTATGR